jgi:uncharacterized protein DUF748
MKDRRHQSDRAEQRSAAAHDAPRLSSSEHQPKKLGRWGRLGLVVFALAGLLGVGRLVLPWMVRDYVNRTLDRNLLYEGRIGEIEIHLWRGAYSIRDLRISKRTGNIPVPLFAGKRVDFSIQWNGLLHGKVVARLLMEEPELNFVDAPDESEQQTGAGGPWLEIIRDLSPFTIDSAVIHNGSVHLRTYAAEKPVDVYLSHLEGSIDDLSNIRRETKPLVTTVQATALVMDQAKLEYKMALDPFSYHPTFHMALRVLGLDVTKINDLALAYGKFGGSIWSWKPIQRKGRSPVMLSRYSVT